MGAPIEPLRLNLGCGFDRMPGFVNVDAFSECQPDVAWNLNETPYPWAEESVDEIQCWHTMEHLTNWWGAFTECARILKVGGLLHIRVPHESSSTALGYRDHVAVITAWSFHGIVGRAHGTSAWARVEAGQVPLVMSGRSETPHEQYQWMARWCPSVLAWCSNHLRNFIWESRFEFRKVGPCPKKG